MARDSENTGSEPQTGGDGAPAAGVDVIDQPGAGRGRAPDPDVEPGTEPEGEPGAAAGVGPKAAARAAARAAGRKAREMREGPADDGAPRVPGRNQGQGQSQGQGAKQAARRAGGGRKGPPLTVVEVRPPAEPSTMKRRHWGVLLSFLLLVALPLGAVAWYLWEVAADQYASTTGFTVRQEEAASATDLLGGLAKFAGGGGGSDSDILYEFIQSQEIVESIDRKLDLRGHYAQNWPRDWVFSIWPDATLEDLVWFWQRIVRISYDQGSGLMEVRVLAFDPEYARAIAREIVAESQDRINQLNEQSREDALRYARADLAEAVARLKNAREALTQFRTRTQIVDPASDIQSRMGVMSNLQQQLAQALIDYDLLRQTASDSDPRVIKAKRLIEAIRQRIALERQSFATDSTENGTVGEDYPTLIAEFESLSVDLQFAEETYRAALAALDAARANAARRSRYLATYVTPTLSQTSEYPQRWIITALAALFLLMFWSILMLIYYSLRDRS